MFVKEPILPGKVGEWAPFMLLSMPEDRARGRNRPREEGAGMNILFTLLCSEVIENR